tara:strand:+ start:819 stop:935 length:117 start_codon:yes stop_codon:yes gene_type:complete
MKESWEEGLENQITAKPTTKEAQNKTQRLMSGPVRCRK